MGASWVGEGIQKVLKNQRQQCLRRKYSGGHLDVVLGASSALARKLDTKTTPSLSLVLLA